MEGVIRSAFVLKLKKGTRAKYTEYHKHIWPEVMKAIRKTGIINYSIFISGDDTLFAYMEFPPGASMKLFVENLNKDPRCCEWENIMTDFQEPVTYAKNGEWWSGLEEIFHVD